MLLLVLIKYPKIPSMISKKKTSKLGPVKFIFRHGALHKKRYFLFPNVLKRWSFQKKIALEYDISCIIRKDDIFPENMIFFFRREMKDNRSQENTWKLIFSSNFWKDSLSKKIALEHDLSCTIRKDGTSFSRINDIFSRRKVKDDLFQKIHGNMLNISGTAKKDDISCKRWYWHSRLTF